MDLSRLNFFEFALTSEFAVHRESLTLVDEGMRESLRVKMETFADAARSAENQDGFDEFMSITYEYDPESGGEAFMAIVFNSFFATSFALFENRLTHICDLAQRSAQCPISVGLLGTRTSIDNVQKYLGALGINFPSGGIEWKGIKSYQEIRNNIMHSGASLSEGNINLLNYAREKQIVSSGRELALTRPFCEGALEDMERFIVKTYRAYSEWRR